MHFKTPWVAQQGKLILLHVWGFHESCTAWKIASLLRTAYFHYLDCKFEDQDKSRASDICCKPYYNGLTTWFKSKKAAFNFAIPMFWRRLQIADAWNFYLTNRFHASSRKIKKSRIPTISQLCDLFSTQIIPPPQEIRIFFLHHINKFLQGRFCQFDLSWRQCPCLFRSN